MHAGKWPVRVNPDDVRHAWLQDPDDGTWHRLDWEHAAGLGTPFSAEAALHARRLAARGGGWPDQPRALEELLARWDQGIVAGRRERRMAARLAAERAALPAVPGAPPGPLPGGGNPEAEGEAGPGHQPGDGASPPAAGGDDDDPAEIFDEPEGCEGITLPGRDPGDIDLDAVTRLVVTDGIPPGAAAAQLGTTISHVRLVLEKVPRPAREWAPSTPPAAWGKWQDRARTLLTREFFDREYLTARKTLHQIEAEAGIPRTHLAARARDHGIPLANAWQPTPIDPQWLRDQYARRSYSDIAAELGVATETVIAAARRHGIPGRPKGVRSRPEMITTLSDDIPADIRRAVEGTLHGWQRLHRFREAMTCPSISTADRQIGAHTSALIHQFQRLEQDIGAPLYHRSSPGCHMRPTARGTALIQALDHPAVRAIAPPPPGRAATRARQPKTAA